MKKAYYEFLPIAATFALVNILPADAQQANTTFTVNASAPPAKINRIGIGGSCIYAHDQSFANSADYQQRAIDAHIGLLRMSTFPDSRNPTRPPSYFDLNVDAAIKVG